MTTPSRDEQLKALAAELGLDALVVMSPENFAFGSGIHIMTVNDIRPRQAFVIVPRAGDVEMILCSIEIAQARQDGWKQPITSYTEFVHHPMDMLADRLKALGLAGGRIGIDTDYLPLSSYQRLHELLPDLVLVNTTEKVAVLRSIKTPEEVAFMEAGTRATHKAVLDAMAASRPGDTEKDMALKIAVGMLANGADGTAFLCFASGDRTPMAHAHATDRVPQQGDIIRFDVGAHYGAYSSDFARTYSAGSPTALQRQTYTALVRAQKTCLDAVRPGTTAEDLFYVMGDAFKANGLVHRQAHIGHGFGIELHETPMLRPGEKTALKPGMVLNIEPSVTDETGARYHTEDLVVVTENGYRLMTLGLAPEELPVIGQKIPVNA